jgi:hypothetical protein
MHAPCGSVKQETTPLPPIKQDEQQGHTVQRDHTTPQVFAKSLQILKTS